MAKMRKQAVVDETPCANCGLTQTQRGRLEHARFDLADVAVTVMKMTVGAGPAHDLPERQRDRLTTLAAGVYPNLAQLLDALDETLAGDV